MARDPKTNGGVDTLYMRQRKVFSPYGISYEKKKSDQAVPHGHGLGEWAELDAGSQRGKHCFPAHLYQPQGHSIAGFSLC